MDDSLFPLQVPALLWCQHIFLSLKNHKSPRIILSKYENMKWTSAINTLTCFHKNLRTSPIEFMPYFCQIGGYTRHTTMKDGSYANIHQSYTWKLTQQMVYQDEGCGCNGHYTVKSTIRTHFSFDGICVLLSRSLYSFQNSTTTTLFKFLRTFHHMPKLSEREGTKTPMKRILGLHC